ncbi:MAG: hypothetical protein LBQ28_03955 [Prevotellaceae bacterium]|jgi:hypothetical protein|nr:hypothetical protein [Prevotellaceae bacterium]
MKKIYFILIALCLSSIAFGQSPESIARKFCTAIYQKDIAKAKSYMTIEDARRTPDKMNLTDEECRMLLNKLNKATVKIIPNQYTDQIVTVRFYDSNYEYLAKNNRWFCCAIELVNNNGIWKVTTYGY